MMMPSFIDQLLDSLGWVSGPGYIAGVTLLFVLILKRQMLWTWAGQIMFAEQAHQKSSLWKRFVVRLAEYLGNVEIKPPQNPK
jgi:hypothetical protein